MLLRTQAGAEVLYDRHVTHIHRKDTGWEVCRKGGTPERFDIVVLTMPVPQILQLQGDVGSCEYITTLQQTHILYTHMLALKLKYDFCFFLSAIVSVKRYPHEVTFYYFI